MMPMMLLNRFCPACCSWGQSSTWTSDPCCSVRSGRDTFTAKATGCHDHHRPSQIVPERRQVERVQYEALPPLCCACSQRCSLPQMRSSATTPKNPAHRLLGQSYLQGASTASDANSVPHYRQAQARTPSAID